MAHIRKRKNGSWQAIIRKKNYPDIVKTFLEKGTASKWSKLVETQMDRKVFQDMSGAESTTLSQLVIKYRDEIVPELRSAKSQTYKLNKLLKHKICFCSIYLCCFGIPIISNHPYCSQNTDDGDND